jgi:hypothetical protein
LFFKLKKGVITPFFSVIGCLCGYFFLLLSIIVPNPRRNIPRGAGVLTGVVIGLEFAATILRRSGSEEKNVGESNTSVVNSSTLL